MNPKELCKDGFKIKELSNKNTSALNSFRVAMRSYFSTYKAIKWNAIKIFKHTTDNEELHNRDYIEMYSETIVHFQHFFELVLKDILREANELLALRVENKNDLFVELVLGNNIDSSILEKQNTVEFTTAFERVQVLVKKDEYSQYSFLGEAINKEALNQLNELRNKIWHRGSFVLRYTTLDLFIGRYILPIVTKLVQLDQYKYLSNFSAKSNNRLETDPVKEIINESSKKSPAFDKIAFFKELARASYNNKLENMFGTFYEEVEDRAKSIAERELTNSFDKGASISDCPCCGIKSLVGYNDADFDEENEEALEFTYQVKCHYCNFELNHLGMQNLKNYGFENEPDYWIITKIEPFSGLNDF